MAVWPFLAQVQLWRNRASEQLVLADDGEDVALGNDEVFGTVGFVFGSGVFGK